MAVDDTTLVNGVTKIETSTGFRYLFPIATITVNSTAEVILIEEFNITAESRTIAFEDIPNQYGASNAEEYVNYLAANGFYFNAVPGVPTIENATTEETNTEKILRPDGTGGVNWVTSSELSNIIVVNQSNAATTLGGLIDSSKEYFLDGIIDMGSNQITIPTTGITIRGYSFDLSGLTSSEDNYTMFVSETPVIGSGNILGFDYYVSVTGTSSKVYELYDATGLNAFEFQRINYIDCVSLGDIYDYRQGLETGTGRFGGSPSLTLHGTWLGGYRIATSIVRNMDNATTEPLFKEGTSFQMNSRFLTDINCDLGTLQPLLDFQPSNFPNPGTLQLQGEDITRNGAYNADDSNLTPNIDQGDLASYWKNNNGLPNTFVGGTIQVISEETTVVSAGSTWYTMEGIFTGTGLQHFSASADGKLTHLGNSPREFEVTGSLTLDSSPNNVLRTRFRKWDNSASAFINLDYTQQIRQVNSLVGGRDVAFFTIIVGVVLDQDDYLQLQVRNDNGNNDIVAEVGAYYRIQER